MKREAMKLPQLNEIWWLKTTDGHCAVRIESAPASGPVRVRTEDDAVLDVARILLCKSYQRGDQSAYPPSSSSFASMCRGSRRERMSQVGATNTDLFAKLPVGVREGLKMAQKK